MLIAELTIDVTSRNEVDSSVRKARLRLVINLAYSNADRSIYSDMLVSIHTRRRRYKITLFVAQIEIIAIEFIIPFQVRKVSA